MTYLALRNFLEVASKTGKPRRTQVRQIKNAGPYTPAIDFYKPLREGIAGIHKAGKPSTALQTILTKISDPRKQTNYPGAINGYRTWWGKNDFAWFDPPSGKYPNSGFAISINPELGLEFNHQRHVVKLYMCVEPLSQLKADLTVALMASVLGLMVPPGVNMSVLDVRQSKLMSAQANSGKLMPMVDAVLADIAAIWPTV
jgi:hypothetical protein